MRLVSDGVDVPPQLRAAEDTGRQAVAELRRTLGVMRALDEHGSLQPVPDLAALPALAEQFEEAGLGVSLTIAPDVDGPDLAASLQLAAYRIVQEALTNVVKHAGPVPVEVDVRRVQDALVVAVRNDPGTASATWPGGHGLAGMRERVAMFGGILDTGPTERGGFLVVARLPMSVLAGATA
jgi:signal transduction histidine kinase